ncbi:MAG: 30S ribosomal protein S20 [Tenericutes bacterium]|nr:30S ribosomal protein S20 [Mycoplasmatota bacterium]
MPNIKSAKKRVITSAKKNVNNTLGRSSMKTAIKKSERAIKAEDKALAEENLKVAIKRIDKACASGLIHKNKAAREKSRLTKQTNLLK